MSPKQGSFAAFSSCCTCSPPHGSPLLSCTTDTFAWLPPLFSCKHVLSHLSPLSRTPRSLCGGNLQSFMVITTEGLSNAKIVTKGRTNDRGKITRESYNWYEQKRKNACGINQRDVQNMRKKEHGRWTTIQPTPRFGNAGPEQELSSRLSGVEGHVHVAGGLVPQLLQEQPLEPRGVQDGGQLCCCVCGMRTGRACLLGVPNVSINPTNLPRFSQAHAWESACYTRVRTCLAKVGKASTR